MSRRFWLYQFPPIIWAAVIFSLSHIPGDNLPSWDFKFLDKLEHAGVFAVFGFLVARALVNQDAFPNWRRNFFWIAVAIGVLYGLGDEVHQLWVPGRRFDMFDVLADGIGAVIGVVGFKWLMGGSAVTVGE